MEQLVNTNLSRTEALTRLAAHGILGPDAETSLRTLTHAADLNTVLVEAQGMTAEATEARYGTDATRALTALTCGNTRE